MGSALLDKASEGQYVIQSREHISKPVQLNGSHFALFIYSILT